MNGAGAAGGIKHRALEMLLSRSWKETSQQILEDYLVENHDFGEGFLQVNIPSYKFCYIYLSDVTAPSLFIVLE